jgi:hypothetical protein
MASAFIEPQATSFRRTLAAVLSYLARLGRLAVVVMAVLIAIVLGLWSGGPLAGFMSKGGWVADVVLKATFVVGTAKELVSLLPRVGKYIWSGLGDGLYGVTSFLFLTFLTLTVASLQAPSPSSDPRTVIFLQAAPEVPLAGRTYSIPFFGKVGCGVGGDFGDGAAPKDSIEFIKQLTTGLSGCSTPERPVTIDVRGYASSKDFPPQCNVNSADMNKQLAKARAEAVVREMTNHEKTLPHVRQPLTIVPMAGPGTGGFNDRDAEGKTDPLKTAMTKRADIVVTDAGTCAAAMK